MKGFPSVKKELKKMQNDMKNKPDENLINGYKNAMKDYEETKNEQCKIAAELIKAEIYRRGLKIE